MLCLIVKLVLCVFFLFFDCYVSDVRSVYVVFDCYVRALPSVCSVLDCHLCDARSLCVVFDQYVCDVHSLCFMFVSFNGYRHLASLQELVNPKPICYATGV